MVSLLLKVAFQIPHNISIYGIHLTTPQFIHYDITKPLKRKGLLKYLLNHTLPNSVFLGSLFLFKTAA